MITTVYCCHCEMHDYDVRFSAACLIPLNGTELQKISQKSIAAHNATEFIILIMLTGRQHLCCHAVV